MAIVEFGVILVGECHGESGVKSIGIISEGVATLKFLGLPCFALDSMNGLNCVSTYTLFIDASTKMSTMVASNFSSSSDSNGGFWRSYVYSMLDSSLSDFPSSSTSH